MKRPAAHIRAFLPDDSLIGRFLCRIGRHRWDYLISFSYASFEMCGRCKTRRPA